MRGIISVILFIFVLSYRGYAQVNLQSKSEVEGFNTLQKESIFVHYNSSVLLVGENLFYQLYCFNAMTGDLSKLSKVAIVELIAEDSSVVFKHKILLKNGLGYGDFFIPTTIESGSYKIVAYTQWMRNGDTEEIFKGDVTLINPYREDDSKIMAKRIGLVDSIAQKSQDSIETRLDEVKEVLEARKNHQIKVKEKYAPREKVVLQFTDEKGQALPPGNYSVSVRKANQIPEPIKVGLQDFVQNSSSDGAAYMLNDEKRIYVPEMRGELFSGFVSAKSPEVSVRNVMVAASIPGENYFFKILMTDALGRFHFSITKNYSGEQMILQVISENPAGYEVHLREDRLKLENLDFEKVELDSTMRQAILERSIHNQIENSFFKFRPDSLNILNPVQFFDNKEFKLYELENYTRFKDFRTTIIEIMKEVTIKRVVKDEYAILVQGFDNQSTLERPSLILLDGCYIQDYNRLLELDARSIEEVKVYKHEFVLGPMSYRGALLIKTNDGLGYNQFNSDDILSFATVSKPKLNKKYFTQRYDLDVNSNLKLPDDRLQLIWLPNWQVGETDSALDFYTSDVSGTFEIQLEGYTLEKQPISLYKTFEVE